MKKNVTRLIVVLSLGFISSGVLAPSVITYAAETSSSVKISQDISDVKNQFNLTDSFLEGIDKTEVFIPTKEQENMIDNLLKKRFIGIDDVLVLIGIVGTGYAAGHWAGAQAHKRFGLSPSSYKSNRWWWRAGISASAGIPAAIGFDDYFYGI